MAPRQRPIIALATVAVLVVLSDLVSKQLAALLLAGRDVPLGDAVRLALVHNDKFAFSLTLGDYTWPINLAVTVSAAVLVVPVCRELAAIDPSAPYGLGLIGGAALGNLVGLVGSPAGVIDFVAIHYGGGRELVLNLADVAAYLGLALTARTGWAILGALRAEQGRCGEVPVGLALREVASARICAAEIEVRRPVLLERPVSSVPGQPGLGDRVRSQDRSLPSPRQRISVELSRPMETSEVRPAMPRVS